MITEAIQITRSLPKRRIQVLLIILAYGVLARSPVTQAQPGPAEWNQDPPPPSSGLVWCLLCTRVGIGTPSPSPTSKLHVFGDNQTQLRIESGSPTATDTVLDLTANGRRWAMGINVFAAGPGVFSLFDVNAQMHRILVDTNGNVGIGTTSPNLYGYPSTVSVLTIAGRPGGGFGALEFAHSYADSAGNPTGVLAFSDPNQSGVEKRVSAIVAATDGATPQNRGGYMNFWTKTDGGALTERVRIDRVGNVGIGTTSPATRLHVVGDLTVTGNVAAKYQDLAEWVPSRERFEAGTVVVLDSEHTNQVATAHEAYDTRVAGVVSERPGLVLGESGKDKIMVATTGRVRVKADASHGAIHIGDLLVTSDQEGYAMKSQPVEVAGVKIHRPGTLIGKALEPLESGTGEILVLLSLQ